MESQIKYTEMSKKEIKLEVVYWRLGGMEKKNTGRLFCLFSSSEPVNKCEGQDLEFKFVDSKGEDVFSGKALVESMDIIPWFYETIGIVTGILRGSVRVKIMED